MQGTEPNKDFIKMEHDILRFWEEEQCFEKLVEKNQGRTPFRFLDGPITANNPMGVHHAWGRSIKDIFLKYKAMNGFSCHYRNGFDAQGLWVEVEVEKELGFKDKKDIENYGTDAFTRKCVERIEKYSNIITHQSKRLGQWMDWNHSYYTHTDENITGIWHFLKVCHENHWITQAHKPMPWCPRCGTSLSEHEMTGSYKEITHTAVFARLPLKEKPYDILVWTTTPWTLSANVALAVNKDLDYVLVDCHDGKRPVVVAANALKVLQGEKTVMETFKGEALLGLHYETFFPFLEVQKDLVHTIIPWDAVSADEGCGVVHIAPGCGAEDYELGKSHQLAEICPIDESGTFYAKYDFLAGLQASEATSYVFERLKAEGKLYKTHEYSHSYPVCWRCKTDVLFRLVREWYIQTDEIKPRLLAAARTVQWEPEYIGKRMADWLMNMGDWNISRKRFYGLPLPFYPCPHCGELTVVGSKEELRALGGQEVDTLPELHRPWIDEVQITCPNCKQKVTRVTEVGDVWLDAGIVPFTTLDYFKDLESWKQYFPAEWVTEMREQVRLWFYSLLFMSVTLTGKAPYQRVLAYNSVVSEDGTKFSKTGFMIKFDEAAEKIGSDTVRYLFAGASTSSDVRFGFSLGDEARRKLLSFYNIYTFFMTYASLDHPDLTGYKGQSTHITDQWLSARVESFVHGARKAYENYNTLEVVREFELCIDEVSNWYIRINRKRFWKQEVDGDKMDAYGTLFTAIKKMLQVMAPIIPFLTEHMWQSMVRRMDKNAPLSVHLSDFPIETCSAHEPLLEHTIKVRELISQGLKLRNERQIKVKQPLPFFYVTGKDLKEMDDQLLEIMKNELNVKAIEVLEDFHGLSQKSLSLNFRNAGKVLKDHLQEVKEKLLHLTPEEMDGCVEKYLHHQPFTLPSLDLSLTPELFNLETTYPKHLAVVEGQDFQVALDTTLDDQLLQEGLYRELLRHCQVLRKEAGLNVEDRIHLFIHSSEDAVTKVLQFHEKEFLSETLAQTLNAPHQQPRFVKTVMVNTYLVELALCPYR